MRLNRIPEFAMALGLTLGVIFLLPNYVREANAKTQCGGASWYALNSMTASGEQMNPRAMTAAHRSLKFGTKVRVTNRRNGRSVVLRINDRGPFIKGRIIDVSKIAARKLGFLNRGKTNVCIKILG